MMHDYDEALRHCAVKRPVDLLRCQLNTKQGFLPGTAQEHGGIIRDGAKLLYAYAGACCSLCLAAAICAVVSLFNRRPPFSLFLHMNPHPLLDYCQPK
jgi:hypothetical protein